MRGFNQIVSGLLILSIFFGCNELKKGHDTLFHKISSTQSNIHFQNNLTESERFNFLTYDYFYNGSGVAIGDINGDDLPDLYFGSNQGANKLYLNQGDFSFKDITDKAGVADQSGWTTGVNMMDINGDGRLDLYVCKSGPIRDAKLRENKLYINNGDLTFTESAAQFGLNDNAFSTQSYFFDYDKDGWLDLYLVNHRIDFENNSYLSRSIESAYERESTDKLYRNQGDGTFEDVTYPAGVLNKAWGLSAAIGDYNNDSWPDIYVANDFVQGDYLYINNQDGTFKDSLKHFVNHTSYFGMGSDLADINNDGFEDLIVLDMVPADHVRSKMLMNNMSTEAFNVLVDFGNHYQYMLNTLQLNNGNGTYSEIAQLAGIDKTDWSWAPLLADYDNDGDVDLFITNGIKKDVTDNDSRRAIQAKVQFEKVEIRKLLDLLPEARIKNYAFENNRNLTFSKSAKRWGLDEATNSNGAAYADLDRDGDLDLVVNNIDELAGIYENMADSNNYIQIKLTGLHAMGSTVEVVTKSNAQLKRYYPTRGYLSSVDHVIHFGLGQASEIVQIKVCWADGRVTIKEYVDSNQLMELDYSQSVIEAEPNAQTRTLFSKLNPTELGLDFTHREDQYDDFSKALLLPHKLSTLGPFISTGDVNNDGYEDVFIGNAKGAAAALYIQNEVGLFNSSNNNLWHSDRAFEDMGSFFFDLENDGDLDLYVVSGGNKDLKGDSGVLDRLYINNGKGQFSRFRNFPHITTSGQTVRAADINDDGYTDLFVGGRLVPDAYPSPASSVILINEQGILLDKTNELAPELERIGMVTDAQWLDVDGDSDIDLAIVGEWMAPTFFLNENGRFKKQSSNMIEDRGWWFSLSAVNLNNDGIQDLIAGNLGQNNKFHPSTAEPLNLFYNDFDDNGTMDIVLSHQSQGKEVPVRGKQCSSEQMPFINDKFPTFRSFAEADLNEIYGIEELNQSVQLSASTFESAALVNQGNLDFRKITLPKVAQFSALRKVLNLDIDKDGNQDLLAVGNLYDSEVETPRYDASYGAVLKGNGDGSFENIAVTQSGFDVRGDVRDMVLINWKDNKSRLLLVSANNGLLQAFEVQF
ncbi:MAG: VCBS repeat-containing protein [Reichenbachiella sp.]|uniref:VCBS repeat-containing protein n=1 Tax=Reichenbachiella sp. TaxID=2184521 RepID=UPI00326427D4